MMLRNWLIQATKVSACGPCVEAKRRRGSGDEVGVDAGTIRMEPL